MLKLRDYSIKLLKRIVFRLRGNYTTDDLKKMGLNVGNNFKRMCGCSLDPSYCWLISIGDNVTLAPNVTILCHDASTKDFLGYSKIGKVIIGNHVFIGAGSVILPNVNIGNNVIVGAGSVVTKNIEDGMVCAGNPARPIMTIERYLKKHKEMMNERPVYGSEYSFHKMTDEKKKEQIRSLSGGMGFIE